MSEPIEIKPRAASLSHQRSGGASARAWSPRNIALAGGGLLLLAGVLWVFLYLPGSVDGAAKLSPITSDPGNIQPGTNQTTLGNSNALPPLQAALREKARGQAESALRRYVDAQLALESMSVENWGADAFADARRLATIGDEKFISDRFEEAISAYESGADALEALIADGKEQLNRALLAGETALQNRDVNAAKDAFSRASQYDSADSRVIEGNARAASLPEVIRLETSARQNEARGRTSAALASYRAAATLDPKLDGISPQIERLGGGLQDERFRALLSEGFAALQARRFDAARQAFDAADALRKGDPAVIGARQQLNEATVLADLSRLRATAEQAMREERFDDAEQAYAKALAIDAAMAFARAGEDRAKQLAADANRIKAILTDPAMLSDDTVMQSAAAVSDRVLAADEPLPGLKADARKVAQIVERFTQPVALTLTSDAATSITIYKVGELGSFESRQVSLRPGRYTIVGVRSGCRDVRAEVVVLPDMDPVDIRCREPI